MRINQIRGGSWTSSDGTEMVGEMDEYLMLQLQAHLALQKEAQRKSSLVSDGGRELGEAIFEDCARILMAFDEVPAESIWDKETFRTLLNERMGNKPWTSDSPMACNYLQDMESVRFIHKLKCLQALVTGWVEAAKK